MNIKKIHELVELMNDNDLAEVEIEQEGMKIRLKKKGLGGIEQTVLQAPAAGVPAPAVDEKAESAAKGIKEIKSPMVGTFYRSPSPDADPYIEVGDIIKKGDVICIVEAMKLMNEVKAELGGRVIEIAVENADAVEFGQTIFKVEPV